MFEISKKSKFGIKGKFGTEKLNWQRKQARQMQALLIIMLIILLPVASALEISGVTADPVTSSSATIRWKTDEPSDSFVHYGQDAASLKIVGDANEVTDHALQISGLTPKTKYVYSVESKAAINDNEGKLYSFETPEPDTTAPEIKVEFPTKVAGTRWTFSGETEIGAVVTVLVNGKKSGTVTAEAGKGEATKEGADKEETDAGTKEKGSSADKSGIFTFTEMLLKENAENEIVVEAVDAAGNKGTASGKVFADAKKPAIDVKNIPSFVTENSYKLTLTVSEKVKFEILVNNKSVSKGEGTQIDVSLPLQEGKNTVVLKLTDEAGLTTEETLEIEASGKPPTIKAEIERGKEFYEGRAFSPISGTTSPGAKVYLYVYKPRPTEYAPPFDRPRKAITANEKGEFRFDDVSFTSSIADFSLEKLMPKEIPSDLANVKIYPLADEVEQQTYYVYLIAEDKAGRTASWQQQVMIQSCFSGNLDFGVESVPEFQAPLRLVPQLVDEGRQNALAVFKLTYNGQGIPVRASDGKILEQGVKVTNIDIEKACTAGMTKDEKFSLGCKLLPARPTRPFPNPDNTAIFASWNLHPGEELSEAKEDFWNELKDRQVIFPLKIRVTYQEVESRDAAGSAVYGPTKVQNSCTDLSYFVDIPIDSKDMIPDFLANEGVEALNWTITQINTVTPYIEQAYIVVGITGMAAFMLRTVARWVRIFSSTLEHHFSFLKAAADEKAKGCEKPEEYYFESTLKDWKEASVTNFHKNVQEAIKGGEGSDSWNAVSLDKRCPSTATAWKFEAIVDQAYKWSWDRAFCRAVPARWTEDKKQEEIARRVEAQQQCAVTGSGQYLESIENCKDFISKNKLAVNLGQVSGLTLDTINICWRKGTDLYVQSPPLGNDESDREKGFYYFTHIGNMYAVASTALIEYGPRLLAYKPPGSENFIVAKDQSCISVCNNPQKPGYRKDDVLGNQNGCYDQKGGLFYSPKDKQPMTKGHFAAGFTRDCFIKTTEDKTIASNEAKTIAHDAAGNPELQQCVCMLETSPKKIADSGWMRVAQEKNKETGKQESWSYQQAEVYRETGGTHGTFYLSERYYSGRDFSGAFGANYLVDYLRAEEKETKVNPNTQIIGAFQSVCLSGILKNLRLLQSMLAGVQSCLIEAKYTGLHDAGMCKTLFTQQVCGLMYQGIAALAGSSCTPSTFESEGKEGAIADAGTVISGGFSAMTKALDTSFEDARKEYGNAVLNKYFQGGTQGFAQSICLAAFGYDFPLFSEDFLLDAAQAFPSKTFPVIAPATRELSSYDPTKQMAIFNYNIGGVIFPGCKVKSWNMKLKCIGPGDRGNPNIDESCGGKTCDCLNVAGTGAAFEAQKEQQLAVGFSLPPAQMFSIPLESPQVVTAPFRYDHVVVELFLDPSEKINYDKCVDSEYLQGNKAVYYFPISDISPPSALTCSVDATSGRYQCLELYSLFGFGGAFLEDPYISCWNKKTETWMACDTPNLFVLGDKIRARAHVNTDGKGQCLKRTINPFTPGITSEGMRQVIQNVQGAQYVEENLGEVNENMFGGSAPIMVLVPGESSLSCSQVIPEGNPTALTSGEKLTFSFDPGSAGTVKLIVPATANIVTAGYSRSGNYLSRNGVVDLPITEINQVQFSASGFTFRNVLGGMNPLDTTRRCVYQIVEQSSYAASSNYKDFTVTYQLLEKDEGGSCNWARQQVKSSLGKPIATQKIRIQKAEIAVSGMHQSFMAGNYQQTMEYAITLLNQRRGDLENALAYYYYIASYIMLGKDNLNQYALQIKDALKGFFDRKWAEQKADNYRPDVMNSEEYKKIFKYLCEADSKFGSENAGVCGGSVPAAVSGGAGGGTTGGDHCKDQPAGKIVGETTEILCLGEEKSLVCTDDESQASQTYPIDGKVPPRFIKNIGDTVDFLCYTNKWYECDANEDGSIAGNDVDRGRLESDGGFASFYCAKYSLDSSNYESYYLCPLDSKLMGSDGIDNQKEILAGPAVRATCNDDTSTWNIG